MNFDTSRMQMGIFYEISTEMTRWDVRIIDCIINEKFSIYPMKKGEVR